MEEVLEELEYILKEESQIDYIDLSGRSINDFLPIYDILSQYPNLKELNMQDNQLSELPQELSGMRLLANLNLNGNQFEDFKETVEALRSLPSLKSVYLNLYQEDQVDYIMRTLDHLDFLNGLKVEREILYDESSATETDEAGRSPGSRVNNVDSPAMQIVERRDTGQSKKGGLAQVNNQIYTIHSESHREEEDDFDSVKNRNPLVTQTLGDDTQRTSHLNINPYQQQQTRRQSTRSNVNQQPDEHQEDYLVSRLEDLDPQDLEAIALIYDNIRSLRRKNLKKLKGGQSAYNVTDKMLAEEFDNHLQTVMGELSSEIEVQDEIQGDEVEGIGRGGCIIKAKTRLMDILVTKLADYSKSLDCQQNQDILVAISQQYILFINQALELASLKIKHIKRAKEVEYHTLKVDTERKHSEQIREMQLRIQRLERENEELRKRAGAAENNGPPSSTNHTPNASQVINRVKVVHTTSSAYNSNHQKKRSVAPLGVTSTRNLTLKQLKDIINDIYSQKIKFDKKCEALKQPRETMEQYMYTYLNQKYGLKNIIIEWAAAIINGIKTYLRDDHDVTLFGKILKNECDEEFRFIQAHVKDTLGSLLKVMIKERYPMKAETEVAKMHENFLTGQVDEWIWRKIIEKMYDPRDFEILESKFNQMLEEKRQAKGLTGNGVGFRQNPNDVSRVSANSYTNAAALGPMMSTAQKKLSREELMTRVAMNANLIHEKLTYAEFQKTILDFQLSEHEKFLYDFTQLFKQVDTDRNGIINEDEFRDLLSQMRVLHKDEELIVLLQIVDPYNNQKMTYSEIVHLLSSHMISAYDDEQDTISQLGSTNNLFGEISVLEKFVNNRTGGLFFDSKPTQVTNQSQNVVRSKSGRLGGIINGTQVQNVANEGQDDIRMMIHNMKQNEDLQTSHIHAEFTGNLGPQQTQQFYDMIHDTQEDQQQQNDYE